jgi:hypothetical protein
MKTLVPTLAIALLLAGCAVEPPPGDEPEGSSTQDPESGDTACLLGRWHLDVPDYQAQSAAYLTGLGVPLESFAMSGTQILDINDEPLITISTDLVTDAVVAGQALSVRSAWAGNGEWTWNTDAPTQLGIADWAWTVDPGGSDDPETIPSAPFFDPESDAPITVTCTDTALSLQGGDAPLVGNFTR